MINEYYNYLPIISKRINLYNELFSNNNIKLYNLYELKEYMGSMYYFDVIPYFLVNPSFSNIPTSDLLNKNVTRQFMDFAKIEDKGGVTETITHYLNNLNINTYSELANHRMTDHYCK